MRGRGKWRQEIPVRAVPAIDWGCADAGPSLALQRRCSCGALEAVSRSLRHALPRRRFVLKGGNGTRSRSGLSGLKGGKRVLALFPRPAS